ncbi:MAG: hypothetical protein WA667_20770 [Candidatus Nitrosopolaris sp.]
MEYGDDADELYKEAGKYIISEKSLRAIVAMCCSGLINVPPVKIASHNEERHVIFVLI